MIHIGIDQGANGGIVFLSSGGNILFKCIIPFDKDIKRYKILEIIDIFDRYIGNNKYDIIIEELFPRHFSGCQQNYAMGLSQGVIETIMITKDLKYERVLPRVWQSQLLGKKIGLNIKEQIERFVLSLYQEDFKLKGSKNNHSGLIDATAIALYSLKKYTEEIEK